MTFMLVPAATAEPSDGRLAQQRTIEEFASATGRDAADIVARLRAADVPDDAEIELSEMQLIERSELRGAGPKPPKPQAGDVETLTEVVREDCGISWAFINDVGARLYGVETGFSLDAPRTAYSYYWRATVTNPFGFSRTHTWGGGLWYRTSWEGVVVDDVPRTTTYTASAWGWAAIYGTDLLCYSQGPSDARWIN